MHAVTCGVVPGDDERGVGSVWVERDGDQLSGIAVVCGWFVVGRRRGLLHDLRRRQPPKHGGHGGDELPGLPWKYCIDGRSGELLL